MATFVFTTLSYFHLVHAIKHSAFFASPSATQILRPAYALRASRVNTWVTVPHKEPAVAELLQVVFKSPQSNNTTQVSQADSIDIVTSHLVNNFRTPDGSTYSGSLCYEVDSKCFMSMSKQSGTLTLAFKPGAIEEWSSALGTVPHPTDSHQVRFQVEPTQAESIGEMRSSKWVAYAARAFVVRFWDLAKVCKSH